MTTITINHPTALANFFSVPADGWVEPYLSDYLPPRERREWCEVVQREFDDLVDRIAKSLPTCAGVPACGFGFFWDGQEWYMNLRRKAACRVEEARRLGWTE